MIAGKKYFIFIVLCGCLLVAPLVLFINAEGSSATVEITARVLLTAYDVNATDITNNSANITWMTNGLSNSTVEYGTTGYDHSKNSSDMVTSHNITLNGLSASQGYHYRVVSSDSAGETYTSPDFTFTTLSGESLGSSILLTSSSAGSLVSPDGMYTVSFPKGSVLNNVVVTLKPYSHVNLQPAPAGETLGATSFEISGLSRPLLKDAKVRVTYSSIDLLLAGADPSRMKISYYDTAKNSWTILPTQVNTKDMSLTTTTNHLSVWAVMISAHPTTVTPTGVPTKIPLPAIDSFGALVAAAVISYCINRHRG